MLLGPLPHFSFYARLSGLWLELYGESADILISDISAPLLLSNIISSHVLMEVHACKQ